MPWRPSSRRRRDRHAGAQRTRWPAARCRPAAARSAHGQIGAAGSGSAQGKRVRCIRGLPAGTPSITTKEGAGFWMPASRVWMASVEWGAIGTSKGARRRPVDGMADDLSRRANRPPISGPPPAGPAMEGDNEMSVRCQGDQSGGISLILRMSWEGTKNVRIRKRNVLLQQRDKNHYLNGAEGTE